jgi:hypothetical protein
MEFNAWWNKESTQRAIAIAQTATVKLTEEMVEDASASKEFCPRCDGLGWVGAPAGFPKETPGYRLLSKGPEGDKWIRDCPKCDGSGSIRKVGDAKAKDTLLEMSGIIQRGKAAVSITQNFGGASHASAISSLDEAMTIDISD